MLDACAGIGLRPRLFNQGNNSTIMMEVMTGTITVYAMSKSQYYHASLAGGVPTFSRLLAPLCGRQHHERLEGGKGAGSGRRIVVSGMTDLRGPQLGARDDNRTPEDGSAG